MTATARHTYCDRHEDGDPICVLQERGVRQVFYGEQPRGSRVKALIAGVGIVLGAAFAALGFWALLVLLLSLELPR